MRHRSILITAVVLLASFAWAQTSVMIEDWSTTPLGHRGIPPGWQGQQWGSPAYDFTIEADGHRRVIHLKSKDEGSTIAKEIKGRINLKQTPILEWSWKAVVLPKGGDSRKKDLDDQAAQIFVLWERFPKLVRSRIIGYVWDSTVPIGTIAKSEKAGTVTYVIVRSGPDELGKWLTERRNIREDFKKIYGEEPENPDAVSLSIDSNDTHTTAESYFGSIAFRGLN
jgi:hypothetical protein